MARPKMYNSSQLVELTENYFVNVACGDPDKLKFSLLAEYFVSCGIEVKAYNLRRDGELLKCMEALRQGAGSFIKESWDIGYKNLEIDELIRNCHDLNGLRKSLEEMDAYWKSIYEKAHRTFEKNKQLHGKTGEAVSERKRLEDSIATLTDENKTLQTDHDRLKKENIYLRGQLKKYLYPAIANELLQRMRLPAAPNESVNPIAFTDFIEGNRPQSFEGEQRKAARKISREEALLDEMKKQMEL